MSFSKFAVAFLLFIPALFAQTPPRVTVTMPPPRATVQARARHNYHAGRVIVKFRRGRGHQFLPGSGPQKGFRDPDLFLVPNPPGLSSEQAIGRYRKNPNVEYAEPDYEMSTQSTPNDPMLPQQWDMNKIAAPSVWDTQTDASDVVVAIIDTGVACSHPDLAANCWTGPQGEHGYSCIDGTCVNGGDDDFGHGTHVAGTIGAVANNGVGIAGLNWKVKLLSLKFLNAAGSGQVSDAILAFDKVIALKQAGVNIRVTNNSWGGGGPTQALKEAMLAVEAAGVVNVCAAGNASQNADVLPMYPGAFDNRGIVSVLASDPQDLGGYFTNYGLASVDIAAPGVSTLSTVPTGSCALCDPSGYKLLSGTSMATPHVSGVLAALFHSNPALTAAEARDIVLDPASYDVIADPLGASTSTGGRLNFFKTLHNPKLSALPLVLNKFPVLTVGPDVVANAGDTVTLTGSASDPDGDPVRLASAGLSVADFLNSAWLMGAKLWEALPGVSGLPASFRAPTFSRSAATPYEVMAADNRGGGVTGTQSVTILGAAQTGSGPSGTLTVSPTDGPVGTTPVVTLNYADPLGTASFDLGWTGPGGSQSCCFQNLNGLPISLWTFTFPGSYRISATLMDTQLRASPRMTTVIHVGGDTSVPPLIGWTAKALTGPAPFTVTFDMSGSKSFNGGSIRSYDVGCLDGTLSEEAAGVLSCTFATPGTRSLQLTVVDSHNLLDVDRAYVVTTGSSAPPPPPPPSDTVPPAVTINSPASGATVSGTVTVQASATDNVGVASMLVTVDGTVLCSISGESLQCPWATKSLKNGPHAIAVAADDAVGNTGNASISVTTSNPCIPRGKSGKCR